MATYGTPATFKGKRVVIDYSAGVRNPRIIDANLTGIVLRMDRTGRTEDELLMAIHERLAEHDGLVARLVSNTDEAIEFAITRQ